MVLDVARFWERGGHPIDLGNRGLCTTLWESINKFIVKKITLLQKKKTLKLLVAKLHSSFEMLIQKRKGLPT